MTTSQARELEVQFQEYMLSDVDEAKALGYNPTQFVVMVQDLGARETARRLVLKPHPSEGFCRLIEMNRPDLTVENAVCNPKFAPLFDADVIQKAKERLQSVGYEPRF